MTRIGKANRSLFASGPPQLSALKQGRIGDCYALAPLGALLNRDPDEVARLFQVGADGAVTVTFGSMAQPIKVATVSDGELALAALTGNDGLWANLFEKAVGQFRVATGKRTGENLTDIGAVATGGGAGNIVTLITGNTYHR